MAHTELRQCMYYPIWGKNSGVVVSLEQMHVVYFETKNTSEDY
jgi:hypothetical protein